MPDQIRAVDPPVRWRVVSSKKSGLISTRGSPLCSYSLGTGPLVYRHLTLALRNLETIDAMRRTAESATDPHEVDDASARRSIAPESALSIQFGSLGENDDFRNRWSRPEVRRTGTWTWLT